MKSLKLLIAWLWVILPLGWGVAQSVRKAMPLFSKPAGQTAADKAVKPAPH